MLHLKLGLCGWRRELVADVVMKQLYYVTLSWNKHIVNSTSANYIMKIKLTKTIKSSFGFYKYSSVRCSYKWIRQRKTKKHTFSSRNPCCAVKAMYIVILEIDKVTLVYVRWKKGVASQFYFQFERIEAYVHRFCTVFLS